MLPFFPIGNHDALTERQAVAVGLPPQVLRDYADLWEVKWTVHPRFAKVVIDGVIYAHGDAGRAGQDAALAQAKDRFRSTVIGHFHSQAGAKWWANAEFRVFGLSVGCGIDASRLQFEYGRRSHRGGRRVRASGSQQRSGGHHRLGTRQ